MTATTHHPGFSTAPGLYGREAEIKLMRDLLEAARGGRGSLLLVGGEAGIGKTTLVDAIASEAAQQGFLVLAGYCYDLDATPPFGPWVELLNAFSPDPDLPHPPEFSIDAAATAAPSSQLGVFSRIQEFFRALTTQRPAVVLLEDQHWADPASLELLRFLARQLREMALVIIVTYRDAELTPGYPLYRYLPQLVREGAPARIGLRRLDDAAVRRMVAEVYNLPIDDEDRLVEYLTGYAEGNPFFTAELLHALEHDRLLRPADTGWVLADLEGAQVPALVRQVIDARVDWLDAQARELLHIAAVIGIEIPLDVWSAIAEMPEEDFASAAEQAYTARLLVELPGSERLRFSHALVREALYDSLILPRRRSLHRKIAELLASRPDAEPDAVAYHYQQAGDPRAVAWLIQAGERAGRRNAIQAAVERYEQALRLLENDDEAAAERAWLLCNLAEAYRYTEPHRALDLLDRARKLIAHIEDRALTTIVLWSQARIRGFLGQATLDDLREAVGAFDALAVEDRTRLLTLSRGYAGNQGPFAQWLGHYGRYDAALQIGSGSIAAHPPDPQQPHRSDIAHALFGVGLAQAGLGHPTEAAAAFEEAYRHFRGVGNAFMAASAIKWQILEVTLIYQADDLPARQRMVEEYRRLWTASESYLERSGDQVLLPIFAEQILPGNWEEARISALAYRTVSFLRMDSLAALTELALLRGDLVEAREHIRTGLPYGPEVPLGTPFFVRTLDLIRLAAELALAEDDAEQAGAWTNTYERWLDWSDRVPGRSTAQLLRARLLQARGERAAATERARAALDLATEPRQPLAQLAALRVLALLEIEAGQVAQAEQRLAAALALANACAAPYERACVLTAQAELATATGQGKQCTALIEEARQTLTGLDARAALERLSALEERAQRQTPSSPALAGLSAREIEVLQLVARGMTDAEVAEQLFISARTVSRHLQSIYAKLDVNTRTAAAAFAYEHRLI
jgi:ATP/maltotriose-dependent transcriptional regulator MalT